MESAETVAVSDFYKLAVLDISGITPERTENKGRFWAFFKRDKVEKLLADYESGKLKVVARDFAASVSRTKDRIFESERIERGANHGKFQPAR